MEARPFSLFFRRGAVRPGGFLVLLLALGAAGARCAAGDPLEDGLRSAREACRRSPGSVAALDRLAALELRSYRMTHAAETLAAARECVDRAVHADPKKTQAGFYGEQRRVALTEFLS